MNKNKKIAMAVVATVMAGAMVVPLAACNNDKPDSGNGDKVYVDNWNILNSDGSINYESYKRDSEVTLNIAVGHEKAEHATAFASGTTYTLADGNTYQGGDMKPAWAQMGKDLNITWNDCFAEAPMKTSANLEGLINGEGKLPYAETDMFTTDLSKAVDKAAAGTNILNLADYLDYMPNFNRFLNENPVVYLSLLQDGMDTTTGEDKLLYIAPYFDGNDDIERYCIIRQEMADKILNGSAALTNSTAWGKGTAVQAFMPKTGNLAVDIVKHDDASGTNTAGTIYKNYDNVKAELAKETSALRTAYNAASNNAAIVESGNIVDIMNAAISANNAVTGDKLVALFRAYVDACYTKTSAVGAESYYAADERSNLFNGYDAAWDVDDLVAMLRCVMTNQSSLLTEESGASKIFGIAPRTGQNDRTPDMVRLACQLYGARGADSRLEYTYIDKDGKLQDARNDKGFYEALNNFSKLTEEGLVADYSGIGNFNDDGGYKAIGEAFMMYDYCQTQTKNGFYNQSAAGGNVADDYNFAPILTPVSKWDVDANGTIADNEYFRFTESWRSTKTSGLALNGNLKNDEAKLKAALQFVDYLYSEDGQIVSTFGPMAENATGTNGFWYGDVQTDPQTKKDENGKDVPANYFTYKGVKYQGYDYKGTVAPTITKTLYESFQGKAGVTGSTAAQNAGVTLNFTNYARILMGSTLPVGVKNQAFEDQLTSECGKGGSAKVAVALSTQTESGYTVVRGMSLKMDKNNWWYTCVPTGLPTPTDVVTNSLNSTGMVDIKYLSGEAKKSGSKEFLSIFNSVILIGIKEGSQHDQQDIDYDFTTVDALLTYMSETKRGQIRENAYNMGWTNAKEYWEYLDSAI